MAFSVTSTQGFEFLRHAGEVEQMFLPGDPGVTYTRGDKLALSNGVLIAATDSLADAVFTCLKTTVCPAATTAFPLPRSFDPAAQTPSATLIPVRVNIPVGTPIELVAIGNLVDDGVTSWTAGTRALVSDAALGGNDYPNGGLVYFYDGTCAGEANIVEDYVDGTKTWTLHRVTASTPAGTDNFISFSGEAATNKGITLFGRIDLKDKDEVDAADGADDGDYVVYAGWQDIAAYLSKGQIPVVRAAAIYS